DGKADIITGSGSGIITTVNTYSGATGLMLSTFVPYAGFAGGASVAAGDVNGDGKADVITGAGPGGGPHVVVFSEGKPVQLLKSFFAYPANFTGGIFVAAGDVNGDGKADIIAASGPGGMPEVKVFSGSNTAMLHDF